MPRASLYFFSTLGRPSMIPARRSPRFRLVVIWAFRCRRPTLAYFSFPPPVTLIRFLTLLFVLFFVVIAALRSVRGGRSKTPEDRGQRSVRKPCTDLCPLSSVLCPLTLGPPRHLVLPPSPGVERETPETRARHPGSERRSV